MRLVVVSDSSVVVDHKLWMPGEIFDVGDKQGRTLLARYPDALRADSASSGAVVEAAAAPEPDPIPITMLTLSDRVRDALDANGIQTVESLRLLLETGDDAVLSLPGIGPRALEELKTAVGAARGA